MNLTLTFRRKITLAIALAATGTIVLCATALLALNAVNNSSRQVSELGEVANALMELQIELYSLTKERSQLTPVQVEAFKSQTSATRSDNIAALTTALNAVGTDVQNQTNPIIPEANQHLNSIDNWLSLKTTFGLTSTDGLLGELNSRAELLNEKVSGFSSLGGKLQTVRQHEKDFLLQANIEEANKALEVSEELKTTLVEYGFEEYVSLTDDYIQALTAVMTSYGTLNDAESVLETQIQSVIGKASEAEHYIESQVMKQAVGDAEQAALMAQQMMIGVGLVVLVLIIALLTWTGLGATRGLNRTMEALKQIASGDLTVRVEKNSDDEFGQLADAVNQMSTDLRDVVGHVTSTSNELGGMSDSLSSAVSTIAEGNQFTSEQTTTMAAATEQMNATVAEISQTTAEVHDASKQAHEAANQGGQVISRALQALHDVAEVVNHNVEQMQELGRRSEKIDVVIEVIKSVAEQTNLLALNAAIEAARAGEAGRGFAVVADEVRSLAEKTVGASNEITEIVNELQQGTREAITSIESSREHVERGNQHGAEAADAVSTIEGQVESTSDRTQQIAVAIEELASTVKEIAQNMEQVSGAVDRSSSESGAIVETSQQVAQHATDLKQLTSRFTIS
ncbi:MAG: methyl-accepting chemotaxis protein [Motiliproteus sp.]